MTITEIEMMYSEAFDFSSINHLHFMVELAVGADLKMMSVLLVKRCNYLS